MASRRYPSYNRGQPSAGPVKITQADGSVRTQAAKPASWGARPNSQTAFANRRVDWDVLQAKAKAAKAAKKKAARKARRAAKAQKV